MSHLVVRSWMARATWSASAAKHFSCHNQGYRVRRGASPVSRTPTQHRRKYLWQQSNITYDTPSARIASLINRKTPTGSRQHESVLSVPLCLICQRYRSKTTTGLFCGLGCLRRACSAACTPVGSKSKAVSKYPRKIVSYDNATVQ